MQLRLRAVVIVAVSAASGCGARSGIALGGAGGSPSVSSVASSVAVSSSMSSGSVSSSSSGGPPCTDDAQCDDGIDCTTDACTPTGCTNAPNDSFCDDGMLCTVDTCTVSGCQNVLSNAPCDDGIACTSDTCDATMNACTHEPCDSMCDDGVFCNGVERCDTALGCTHGPAACELGLTCSADACDEASQTCVHNESAGCAPPIRLLVCDSGGALFSVSPFGGPSIEIAPSNGTAHFDVAILAGRWFAIDASPQQLVELFPNTNAVKVSFPAPDANSLGAGPDGQLYAAGSDVYRLDPDSGAITDLGPLPAGYTSSGDIAFLNGAMYVSTDGPCGGALVEFDPSSGSSTVLGGDGLGCVYGLGVANGTMFVVNCDGKVGTFDPVNGIADVLSTTSLSVYGADVLP